MITIACITFGHSAEDVERCLSSAVRIASGNDLYQVLTIDDGSGQAPSPSGIAAYETPSRRGFAATAQYIVDELTPSCTRLILVNPDAEADELTLEALANTSAVVAVPTIRSSARNEALENVRFATTGSREVRNMLLGERSRAFPLVARGTTQDLECPPLAPSGAVISISAADLRATPLRAEMFWLEFSDWVLRRRVKGLATDLAVLPNEARHVGASTSVRYPLSVAASQARAKVCFVRDYGSPIARSLVGPAVLSRAIRFALMRRSISSGVFLYQAALGRKSWMVNA